MLLQRLLLHLGLSRLLRGHWMRLVAIRMSLGTSRSHRWSWTTGLLLLLLRCAWLLLLRMLLLSGELCRRAHHLRWLLMTHRHRICIRWMGRARWMYDSIRMALRESVVDMLRRATTRALRHGYTGMHHSIGHRTGSSSHVARSLEGRIDSVGIRGWSHPTRLSIPGLLILVLNAME
jgi:hypothetical protein